MKTRKKLIITWFCIGILYFLFLIWNGLFTKPLSGEEIEKYTEILQQDYSDSEFQQMRSFMEEDDGKPVIMVNVIKTNDIPKTVNGKTFGSSEEALAHYTSFVGTFLIKRGSYPIFNGTSLMDAPEVWGIENAREWTTGSLVRYKSRRVMLELSTNPDFKKFHDSKVAGIEKTFAFPVSTNIHLVNLSLFVAMFLMVVGLIISLFFVKKAK
ncbi:hypothetical protein [Seonamhaeicola sp.]|uniref:hypothetical protein n=1 Tax=Seonamhaeicola sp. TaxID=1912245 RepID=UPI0026066268|nr:hypothetical protein [Seonamhaeicola sp.]